MWGASGYPRSFKEKGFAIFNFKNLEGGGGERLPHLYPRFRQPCCWNQKKMEQVPINPKLWNSFDYHPPPRFYFYLELVSKELNHFAAILHVYAGGLNFMK